MGESGLDGWARKPAPGSAREFTVWLRGEARRGGQAGALKPVAISHSAINPHLPAKHCLPYPSVPFLFSPS